MSDFLEAMSRTLILARDLIASGEITDADIAQSFTDTTVTLVADAANLESAAAQSAFVTTFMLIARQGCTICLRMPTVPVCGFQPPLRGNDLQQALLDLSQDLIPGGVVTTEVAPSDLTVVLGNTPWTEAGMAWRIGADEWSGWTSAVSDPAEPIRGDFPMGAFVAAALVAAEPFKAALRRLEASGAVTVSPDFTPPVLAARFSLAPDRTPVKDCEFEDIDAISGGAITNAFLYCLLRVPGLSGKIRVFEPEVLDLSNNNRYALARRSDLGIDKIEVLKRYSTSLLAISGVKVRFDSNAKILSGPLAPRAVVGADDIPTRWFAQKNYQRWLGIGATSHFLTMTSSHEAQEGCAGCLHPHNDLGPEIIPTASFVSFWAGLLLAARLLRYDFGVPYLKNEQVIPFYTLQMDQKNNCMPYEVPGATNCPIEYLRCRNYSEN